jgi:magnesium transporter
MVTPGPPSPEAARALPASLSAICPQRIIRWGYPRRETPDNAAVPRHRSPPLSTGGQAETVIRFSVYSRGQGLQEDVDAARISELLQDRSNLLWIIIDDPTDEDFAVLREEFPFHKLALEDARKTHQRPKIEEHDGYYFIVFYAARDSVEELALSELDLFLGPNYLVTIHRGIIDELEETVDRWRRNLEDFSPGIAGLLYSLLDTIADRYFPILDAVAESVDAIEAHIFERPDRAALQEIFTLRKQLLAMRRVVAPERDVLNVLARRDAPIFEQAAVVYFQDIYDHLIRVTDSIDVYRDLLSTALDSQLTLTSNNLNVIVKRLTSLTVILAVPTLIASNYGMNFLHMPELDGRYGYFVVIGAMVAIIAGLILFFRRLDWL